MSDELETLLRQSSPRRPASTPSLKPTPRVQGGLPLEGGARLDLSIDQADRILGRDAAEPLAGPHLNMPEERPTLQPLVTPKPVATPAAAAPPMPAKPEQILRCTHLKKSYHKGRLEVPVLSDVSLEIRRGEFVAIVGQSGSGKSTLLHLLATLDAPDSGQIHFLTQRIDRLTGSARDRIRNHQFGMIFQFYHLLPELTTLENVLAPLMIGCSLWGYLRHRREYREAATELLRLVGLEHRLKHKPTELSGGEMQRAAIARALVARPQVLLADEPTGNLDQATGQEIMKILRTLNRDQKLTIVMVTHDQAIAAQADRTIRLSDGRISD